MGNPIRISEVALANIAGAPKPEELQGRGFRFLVRPRVWEKQNPNTSDYAFSRRVALGFLQSAIGDR